MKGELATCTDAEHKLCSLAQEFIHGSSIDTFTTFPIDAAIATARTGHLEAVCVKNWVGGEKDVANIHRNSPSEVVRF